jgi:hypothetical protein
VPVSRKRKKSRKPKTSARASQPKHSNAADQARHELARATPRLGDYRRQLEERRASLVAAAAEALVAELVGLAPVGSDVDFEDELCARLGARLAESADGPLEDHVTPDQFVDATIAAAAAAVHTALDELAAEPEGWQTPWRVLTTAASIVPFPVSAAAADAIEDLRSLPDGGVLPGAPDGPAVTGRVLWARDAYGSRFGIIAAFSTPGGPDRWYLWDIDSCGYQAFTVYSAYYPTLDQAQAAWRAGVGPVAAGEAAFVEVDDPALLVELLPDDDFLRAGGAETGNQFAEYHRTRRLAEAVAEAVGPSRAARPPHLDAATAVTEFSAWLQTLGGDQPHPDVQAPPADMPDAADDLQPVEQEGPDDADDADGPLSLDELVKELADSWCFVDPAALAHTCSPHRVAQAVLHLRNFYKDHFATRLIALLPAWTAWLAERNGTPPELAERCRPYALGETHADVGSDDSRPRYRARVIE